MGPIKVEIKLNNRYSARQLWQSFYLNILVIVIFGAVFSGGAYLYAGHKNSLTFDAQRSFFIYRNVSSKFSSSAIQGNIAMMDTYSNLLTDHSVTNRINDKMQNVKGYTYNQQSLPGQLNYVVTPGTTFIKAHAEANSAAVAKKMANTAVDVAAKELPKYIGMDVAIKKLAPAQDNPITVNNSISKKKFVAFGFALGAVLGAFVMFTYDLFANKKLKIGKEKE